jgi:hypothetical protein
MRLHRIATTAWKSLDVSRYKRFASVVLVLNLLITFRAAVWPPDCGHRHWEQQTTGLAEVRSARARLSRRKSPVEPVK